MASKRIDWLYDPTAHRKQKTEAEKMNEAVDLAQLAAESKTEDDQEEEELSRDVLEKIKEDPLFAIRRTELRKKQLHVKTEKRADERNMTRSRSPRRNEDRQKRLKELLLKSKKKP